MRFIVIGIQDHPQPFFPPEVLHVISHGTVFSGGKRHHEIMAPWLPSRHRWIDITIPLDAVFQQYDAPEIIVFASGDPLFYGFANTIRTRMPDADLVVYPSFNSLQTLAHRLVMPYHDMRTVSLTGRPWHEFDNALIQRAGVIGVLTDRTHTPTAIAQRMLDYGYTDYTMYVGEHLGHPTKERISTCRLDEATRQEFSHPNCLILVRQHPLQSSAPPFGIPDSAFMLLNGRQKMITKMPIRLLTLQRLDLPCRHVFWDIGFCTGSVSIEARLQFPHLHIDSFEIREECENVMLENCHKMGTPGIEVHICDFLEADLTGIPRPDAVFIGGHGGKLKAIISKVNNFLSPEGCIVMNSVTPQSKSLFESACVEQGLVLSPSMHVTLNDFNPIEILKCTKQPSSPSATPDMTSPICCNEN